jgi:peptidoglycan/xylan/chitin deacetylase (PgdA/CDA1 family)
LGVDCSGLVHLLFKSNGVALPRDADPQSKVGVAVARTNLQPGDLVFFSSGGVAYHVAIYSGAGRVIDSPSPGYGVEEVPLNTMRIIADYSGARRLVPSGETPTPSPSVPASSLAGAEWTKLPTTDKVVALTFDAGGNNAGVGPIMQELTNAGVPATFFLTGRWTEVYPADAKMIAATYGIGNHTYSHPRLTDLTDAEVRDQVTHAEAVIKATAGHDPHPLFRFPYGSTNARVLADVHALGYRGIRWTVDTLGWKGRSQGQSDATVLQRVVNGLQPGEIVLMHVGAANDGTPLDANALPAVIRELRARGYRFVLVSDYAR